MGPWFVLGISDPEPWSPNQAMRPHIGFNAEILFITSCTDTTVIIHGKFNNASVTTCKNLAIIVENVIASVEIIKSNDVKLQVLHKCKQAIVDRSVKTGMKLLHNIFKTIDFLSIY